MSIAIDYLPRYPDYKASGVDWLGQIPAHWETQRLKLFAEFVSRGTSPIYVDESSILVINQACVYWSGLNLKNVKYQREENISDWRGLLYSGDLLLNSTGTGTLGRAVIFNKKGRFIADSHITIIRFKNGQPYYFYYLIQTPMYQDYIYSSLVSGSTNQIELSREGLLATTFIFPPLAEQHAIANFLDRETVKIDELVAEFERLLELIMEKRQAAINHSVTRGIYPNVKLCDSGIEWIGEIPESWKIEFAKWLFKEIDERSTTGEEELLTVSHITGVTPRSEKEVNMFMAESLENYKICQPSDLVINTMWAWMGAMGVAFQEGIVSPSYHVYRSLGDYEPRYLDYMVRLPAFAKEVTRYSKGVWSSRLRLYPEEFFKLVLPVPPLEEQREIVAYLDAETAKLDELNKATQETIQLLQERRSALITAAVSGQINVI
ncbi:MAG: restriction endonuclease subunit S [Chloroflexota bacterium]